MPIIEPALWHEASWAGVAFRYRQDALPLVAIVFEHQRPAERIFEGLHDLVGSVDRAEGIRVAFIEGGTEVTSYAIHVCASPSTELSGVSVCRLHWMDAAAPHLARFRAEFERQGRYLLVPGIVTTPGRLVLLPHLAIEKTQVAFRQAADIADGDIDAFVLGLDLNDLENGSIH